MAVIVLIFGLLLFVGLVIAHEFGHFIMARRNGVVVEEFGIGFPPRARVLGKKKGTVYTLNWLPLGGFVKLKGEHDADTSKGSFGAASLKAKVKVMLAGVVMNFLVAVFLFTILALTSLPKADLKRLPFYDRAQFTVASDTKVLNKQVLVNVAEDSPASEAGLKDGDDIIKIGGNDVLDSEYLSQLTEKYKGQTVEIVYRRSNGPEQTTRAALNPERDQKTAYLGVEPLTTQTIRATWSAPIVGVVTAAQYTELSFRGLGFILQNLFAGHPEVAGDAVGGPVATFKIISDVSSLGIDQLLFVIGLISVSLAVMNVLPIPALDGGRLFVTLLFRALKKPLTKEVEERIHGTGFVALLGLIVLVTIIDIRRFF